MVIETGDSVLERRVFVWLKTFEGYESTLW